ncbi:MAG: sugar ABC transporter substrate-binding protein [Steroidobacteraceae bacterium]
MRTRVWLAAAALGLSLCGGAGAATTLKLVEVITSPERTETLRAIVKTFENANPGTEVEIISLPWGPSFEKLATMVAAGDTPDVVEMPDMWLALYANNGWLESLEPYLKTWPHTRELNQRTLQLGRVIRNTAYMLPYGFYLRALYYNKKMFAAAGIAAPPRTVDEFVAVARRISATPGRYGYCLRGGPGGVNGWMMFGALEAGNDLYFHPDGTSTFTDPGWIHGFATLAGLYRDGLAPPDSVNWGYNDIVAGFYSGVCAMIDNDPDALIAIASRMKSDDYGIAPWIKGVGGKSFPTIGYGGWSMFANSQHKDLAWKLIATLDGVDGSLIWNRRIGALPIYTAAAQDPMYADPRFKGWFEELADPDVQPMVMPMDLRAWALFASSIVPRTSQSALLGKLPVADMAQQWAKILTRARQSQQ